MSNFRSIIGIVVQRIEVVRSQVEGHVAGTPNNLENSFFERETGMVASNGNLHYPLQISNPSKHQADTKADQGRSDNKPVQNCSYKD
jgi:hypothetical protein